MHSKVIYDDLLLTLNRLLKVNYIFVVVNRFL